MIYGCEVIHFLLILANISTFSEYSPPLFLFFLSLRGTYQTLRKVPCTMCTGHHKNSKTRSVNPLRVRILILFSSDDDPFLGRAIHSVYGSVVHRMAPCRGVFDLLGQYHSLRINHIAIGNERVEVHAGLQAASLDDDGCIATLRNGVIGNLLAVQVVDIKDG